MSIIRKFNLALPLYRGGDTNAQTWLEISLQLDDNAEFDALAGHLADGALAEGSVQSHLSAQPAALEVTLTLHESGGASRPTATFRCEGVPLQLDLGQIQKPDGAEATGLFRILLHGSLVLPLSHIDQSEQWLAFLGTLWPTGRAQHVKQIRIEPTGLYLQGWLPAAFFAPTASAADDRLVVLRVPQHQDLDFEKRGENTIALWTLEAYPFIDPFAQAQRMTAADFVREYTASFFPKAPVTFIDNLVSEPDEECAVRIPRIEHNSANQAEWRAEQPGVRIMIGVGGSSEVTFYPTELAGRVELAADGITYQRAGLVEFRAGVRRLSPAVGSLINEVQLTVALAAASGLAPDDKVKLTFAGHKLAALHVPADPPVTVETALPAVAENSAHEHESFAWLCTESGWIAVRVPRLQARISRHGLSAGAVFGDIEITSLYHILRDSIADAGGANAEPELQISIKALGPSGPKAKDESYVSVGMANADSPSERSLVLHMQNVMVIAETPKVWYQPLHADSEQTGGASPTPAAGSSLTQTPPSQAAQHTAPARPGSLPVLTPAGPKVEEYLDEVLQPATFVSAHLLENVNESNWLHITAEWEPPVEQTDGAFRFALAPHDRITVWQRSAAHPLVQSVPLSPTSARGFYLDSNRGLLPYRLIEGSLKINFQRARLPYFAPDAAPPIPYPPPTSDQWQIQPEFAGARYFLPTLPGIEATLAAGESADALLHWGYRYSVPALDEAYAESAEGDDKPSSVLQRLPFSRIAGTQAFVLPSPGQIEHLLPRTPDNPEGAVEVEGMTTADDLRGLHPALEAKLAGLDAPINLSREGSQTALRGLAFNATPNDPAANGGLPEFSIDLSENGGWQLVEYGQPLVSTVQNDRIFTLDGAGRVQAEPVGGTVISRLPDRDRQVRHTTSYELQTGSATALHLDLVGVTAGELSKLSPEDLAQESWMLHDGEGGWPYLLGFPLSPRRLVSFDPEQSHIIIEATLMPRTPEPPVRKLDQAKITVTATTQAADFAKPEKLDYAAGAVMLTFGGEANARKLHLSAIEGQLDWRFPTTADFTAEEPHLVRLRAQIEPTEIGVSGLGDSLSLQLREVALTSPLGLLRLLSPNDAGNPAVCTLHAHSNEHGPRLSFEIGSFNDATGEFQVVSRSREGRAAFRYAIAETHIPSGRRDSVPLPALFLGWENQPNDNLRWQLFHSQTPHLSNADIADWQKLLSALKAEIEDKAGQSVLLAIDDLQSKAFQMTTFEIRERQNILVEFLQTVINKGSRYLFPIENGFYSEHQRKMLRRQAVERTLGSALVTSRWRFRLRRGENPLLSDLVLKSMPIGSHRYLFEVSRALPLLNAGDRAWLRSSGRAAGFLGVHFTPDTSQEDVQDWLVRQPALEVQIDLVDQYPNDALLIWDPGNPRIEDEAPQAVMRVMDRNVGIIDFGAAQFDDLFQRFRKEQVVNRPVGIGTSEKATIVWVDADGGLRQWDLVQNRVRRLAPGREWHRIALKKELDKSVVLVDRRQNVFKWDLNDAPDQIQAIEPVNEADPVADMQVTAMQGSDGIVVWARANKISVYENERDSLVSMTDSPHSATVRALDTRMLRYGDGTLRLTGASAADNDVCVWVLNGATLQVTQRMEHNESVRSVAFLDSGRIATVNANSLIRIWPKPPKPEEGALEELTSDGVLLELTHAATIREIISLGGGESSETPQHHDRLAVLNEDGSVVYYKIGVETEGPPTILLDQQTLAMDDCRPTTLSTIQFDKASGEAYRGLVLSGPAASTQLSALIRFDSKGLHTEVTGKWVLQDSLNYVEKIKLSATDLRFCTHRLDLYLDRAPVAIESLWQGIGPGQDYLAAAVVEHVFRCGVQADGPAAEAATEAVIERRWQAPQMLRFTTLERYKTQMLNAVSPAADEQDDALVIDAGSIFWLQWPQKAPVAVSGAGQIANDRFRLLLRPQETWEFAVEASHIVRLPAAVGWGFRAPDEPADPPPPPAQPMLEVPPIGGQKRTAWTSGDQFPTLLPVAVKRPRRDLPLEQQLIYYNRTAEADWLDAGFLAYTLNLESQNRHQLSRLSKKDLHTLQENKRLESAPGAVRGLAPLFDQNSPTLPTGVSSPDAPKFPDLCWLRDSDHDPSARYLLAATVASKHQPNMSRQTLSGSALFHFPYTVHHQPVDGMNLESRPYDRGVFAQLVVFADEKLRRAAQDYVGAIEGEQPGIGMPAERRRQEAEAWGRRLLAERRCNDAAFVLLNYSEVIPIPRPQEAAGQEQRHAHPWALHTSADGIDDPDPRCLTPGAAWRGGDRLSIKAAPWMGLLLFNALPVPANGARMPAATRFRLARTGANDAPSNHLQPAYAQMGNDWSEPGRLLLTQRDDVPFQEAEKKAEGQGDAYPSPNPRRMQERPLPAQDDGTDRNVASLQPPLVDVVSWAARPGEQMRSLWQLQELSQANGQPVLRASAPVGATLRRPRAVAGPYEAVRLKWNPGAVKTVFGGRFHHVLLTLQQILDRSGAPKSKEVSMSLVTRRERFTAVRPPAQSDPAAIYYQETLTPENVEELALHLIADKDFRQQGQTARRILLMWRTKEKDLPHSFSADEITDHEQFIYDLDNAAWSPADDDSFTNYIYLREAERSLLLKSATASLSKNTLELVIAQYTQNSVQLQEYEKPQLLSVLHIKFLSSAGRLTAPPVSVALVMSQEPDSGLDTGFAGALTGYGRLSDSDFSLIEPQFEVGQDNQKTVAWMRATELEVLDRASPLLKLEHARFDVVVSGPGGELLPMEQTRKES